MPVEDDYTNGDFAVLRTTIDSFGVPSNLTGNHPEEFFSMLGRIVALSALLENRVLVFYQYLVGRRQDEHTELGVGTLIANALSEIQRLPEPADRQLAEQFLMEAKAITGRRNDYVHNLWPAQSDGRLFGWRVPQMKNAQDVRLRRAPTTRCATISEVSSPYSRLATSTASWDSFRVATIFKAARWNREPHR